MLLVEKQRLHAPSTKHYFMCDVADISIKDGYLVGGSHLAGGPHGSSKKLMQCIRQYICMMSSQRSTTASRSSKWNGFRINSTPAALALVPMSGS